MFRYAMKAKVAESCEMEGMVTPKMAYHAFGRIQSFEVAPLSADLSDHGKEE
jgi:hypothetical protein